MAEEEQTTNATAEEEQAVTKSDNQEETTGAKDANTDDAQGAEETPDTENEEASTDDAKEPAEEAKEAPEEDTEEAEEDIERSSTEIAVDEIRPGMTIRVHEKITDLDPRGEKRERTQVFEGMVLGMRGSGVSKTMTIRKVLKGYGIEKIYPVQSPIIQKVELVKTARVRKSKLNYLKNTKQRFKRKLKEVWADRA